MVRYGLFMLCAFFVLHVGRDGCFVRALRLVLSICVSGMSASMSRQRGTSGAQGVIPVLPCAVCVSATDRSPLPGIPSVQATSAPITHGISSSTSQGDFELQQDAHGEACYSCCAAVNADDHTLRCIGMLLGATAPRYLSLLSAYRAPLPRPPTPSIRLTTSLTSGR